MPRPQDKPATLNDQLRALAVKRSAVGALKRALDALALAGCVTLGVFLVDAIGRLPAAARWTALGALIVLAAVATLRAWQRRKQVDSNLATARAIERAHGLLSNPLISAAQIQPAAAVSQSALARELAGRVQQRGAAVLAGLVAPLPTMRAPLKRAAGRLWAVVVLWLIVACIQPGVIARGADRLFIPGGSERPFSLTKLTVSAAPNPARAGDQVKVTVQIRGLLPQSAQLVPIGDQGSALAPRPMRRNGEDQFTRTLVNVREPIHFYVTAGTARSQPVTIAMRRAESDKEASTADASTQNDNAANTNAASNQKSQQPDESASRPQSRADLTAQALARKLEQLAKQLKQWAAQARAIEGRIRQGQTKPAARELAALRKQARAGRAELAALRKKLATEANRAAHQALLTRTRRAMANAKIGQPPPKADAANQAGRAGAGDQSPRQQAQRLRRNAQQDAGTFDTLAEAWRQAARPGQAARPTGADGTADSPIDARASGRFDETVAQGQRDALPGAYDWHQVPPQYRKLVGAYFNRLSQEAQRARPDAKQPP